MLLLTHATLQDLLVPKPGRRLMRHGEAEEDSEPEEPEENDAKVGTKKKRSKTVNKKIWKVKVDTLSDKCDVFIGRHAKNLRRFIEAVYV